MSRKEKALREIAARHGGILRPKDVVQAARNPRSPLHNSFCWDDTEAAEQYRLWQARTLIRVTVQMTKVNKHSVPVRVWVSLKPDREDDGGYREVATVLTDSQMRHQMLKDALEELEVFERKYSILRELAAVFEAVHKIKRKWRGKRG